MSSKPDGLRRAFLKGAVIGAGVAGVGFPVEARAQTNDQQRRAKGMRTGLDTARSLMTTTRPRWRRSPSG
jgi:hypothetical protein